MPIGGTWTQIETDTVGPMTRGEAMDNVLTLTQEGGAENHLARVPRLPSWVKP